MAHTHRLALRSCLPALSSPGLHLPKMRVWVYRGASGGDQVRLPPSWTLSPRVRWLDLGQGWRGSAFI